MIRNVLIDLDNTILDFDKAEQVALGKTMRELGLEPTDERIAVYHRVNKLCWERLERKEIERAEVFRLRFALFFKEVGIAEDPDKGEAVYEKNLSVGHYFMPGAEELLKTLSAEYRLFLASNGVAAIQKGRIASAGIAPYFEQMFVSEHLGYNKPDPAYFDAAFALIPGGVDRAETVIIGDSLTSDILGGNNAGIRTVWFNPTGAPRREGVSIDREVSALTEIPAVLKTL